MVIGGHALDFFIVNISIFIIYIYIYIYIYTFKNPESLRLPTLNQTHAANTVAI